MLSGHEHFYERLKPQHGITYFVSGAAGSLRAGDIQRSSLTAKGFDSDYSFILMEVSGDDLFFQAISRSGIDRRRGRHLSSAAPGLAAPGQGPACADLLDLVPERRDPRLRATGPRR